MIKKYCGHCGGHLKKADDAYAQDVQQYMDFRQTYVNLIVEDVRESEYRSDIENQIEKYKKLEKKITDYKCKKPGNEIVFEKFIPLVQEAIVFLNKVLENNPEEQLTEKTIMVLLRRKREKTKNSGPSEDDNNPFTKDVKKQEEALKKFLDRLKKFKDKLSISKTYSAGDLKNLEKELLQMLDSLLNSPFITPDDISSLKAFLNHSTLPPKVKEQLTKKLT